MTEQDLSRGAFYTVHLSLLKPYLLCTGFLVYCSKFGRSYFFVLKEELFTV
jgi:hypothetical protein